MPLTPAERGGSQLSEFSWSQFSLPLEFIECGHIFASFLKKVQNIVLQNWTFLILTQVFSSCYVVDDKEKSWHALKRSDYFALKKSVKSTWVDFQSQQSPIFGWFSSHFYIIAKVSLYYWKKRQIFNPVWHWARASLDTFRQEFFAISPCVKVLAKNVSIV